MKKENYLKKIFGLGALLIVSTNTYTVEAPMNADGTWSIHNGNYEITTNATKILNIEGNFGVSVNGNSNLELTVPLNLDIRGIKPIRQDIWLGGISLNGDENGIANLKALDIDLKISPAASKGVMESSGIEIGNGAKMIANNLNIDLTHQTETIPLPISSYHENTTGILFHGAVDELLSGDLERYSNRLTEAKVKNATIKVKNTANSDSDILNYSLQGIEMQRYDNKSYNSILEVENKLDIEISDISTKQNANNLIGIRVAGEDTKISLKDTKVVLKGNGDLKNSTAISIGDVSIPDPADDFYGNTNRSGIVESKGKMILDTTQAKNASAIYMKGNESQLKANFENSSSEIKVAGNAITFGKKEGYFDDSNSGKYTIEEGNGSNQVVSLKNATITSTEIVYSPLIRIEENVKNATLNLSGNDTKVSTTNNALMLIENGADITFNLTDGAFVEGGIQNITSGVSRLNITNGSTWRLPNDGSLASNVTYTTLKSGGIIDATGTSTGNYTIKTYAPNNEINFINDNGTITMANNSYDDKLTIHGNYNAKNGELKINTLWNNASGTSKSDLLIIENEATGITKVKAVGIDGTENIIDGDVTKITEIINSIPVVKAGTAKVGTFRGKARTTGAGEVQLTSRLTANGEREFFWTTSPVNLPNEEGKAIYSAVVPAYINTLKNNMNLGFTVVGTLHERRGENKLDTEKNGKSWGRIIGKNYEDNGKERFDTKTEIYGIQAGYDFSIKEDSTGRRNTGIFLAHTEAKNKFYDRYRSENGELLSDKYTGNSKTKDLSFGITSTKYYENDMYVDIVGQFSILNNKYNSRDNENAKQKGNRYLISTELGKSYKLSNSWEIEPQAQLMYQYLKLKDFNDGIRTVKYGNEDSLRGRLGFRIIKNQENKKSFYVLTNIWHDFQNTVETNIGKDKVKEKYSSTWAEIGIGLQLPVTHSTLFYGDIRYEKSFKSNPKYNGYRGTVGIKYSF